MSYDKRKLPSWRDYEHTYLFSREPDVYPEVYRIGFVCKCDIFKTLLTTLAQHNILPICPFPLPQKKTTSGQCELRSIILLHMCDQYPINHHPWHLPIVFHRSVTGQSCQTLERGRTVCGIPAKISLYSSFHVENRINQF